jgi:trans-aconitate methyltransferase
MTAADRESHWENVYVTKDETAVSWFEESPGLSLDFLARAGAGTNSAIIDIGGGASRLVDALLARGHGDLTVLDLSAAALKAAAARLGGLAGKVEWIAADVTTWTPPRQYDVWHDRAAFHFLMDEADRAAYTSRLEQALRPGGHAIIATFAPDGPEKCSGLPVQRHDAESLGRALGAAFALVHTERHIHTTPWGSEQRFQFSLFRRA